MKYVIYCDESRHDLAPDNHFMAIGGLWVPADQKTEITNALKAVRRDSGLGSEVKWSKTSRACLEGYKRLVDFFFQRAELNFRVILVDQTQLKMEQFHGGDRELGFYKFYYEMLVKWLAAGNEYLVLLDFKQNKGADRYTMLRKVLEHEILSRAWVSDLTVIDSRETPLAQLADLLTGAAAAAWCQPRVGSAKEALIEYIGQRRGARLTVPSAGPGMTKFNVFKIELQQ
ncbi:MAG: DUF3800 domain-containing protein [Candidatus Hydrogenedentes bacterium]|nr:DUF3800 domain-containing protein [Candidatus Hydrogenedentota bacterium]